MSFTEEQCSKILQVVDHGLIKGLGIPEPGKMCIEAAVSFALGLPHTDNLNCVGSDVRRFKISLNDSHWSSDKNRAKGLRKLAIAQLGSNSIDQIKFSHFVIIETIKQILPIILDNIGLKEIANDCRNVIDFETASIIINNAFEVMENRCKIASTNFRNISKNYSPYDLTPLRIEISRARLTLFKSISVINCIGLTERIVRSIINSENNTNNIEITVYIACIVGGALNQTEEPDYMDQINQIDQIDQIDELDQILNLCAKIGLDALIKLDSPGCKFLYLCE
jgi:hypothetical protein